MIRMRLGSKHFAFPSDTSYFRIRTSQAIILILLFCFAGLTVGCGLMSSGGDTARSNISVSVPAVTGKVGVPYNVVVSVSGGNAPYLFTASGSMPPGVALNTQTGSITGTPKTAGDYSFTVSVSDLPRFDQGTSTVRIVVNSSSTDSNPSSVAISPNNPSVVSQGVQQFTATVTGTTNTSVTWTASAGTISNTGLFTAPRVSSGTTITVTATSAADNHIKSAVSVLVNPSAPLAITSGVLPEADAAAPYSTTLSASGGTVPYSWSISSGALPSGIQLQTSGLITGSATAAGSYSFTAKVSDATGANTTRKLTLSVSSSSARGFDGPAELPRITISTALANTPAPGATVAVNAGGDLQSALDAASCGDTISLHAGATFSGVFTFPAKNCDDNHWIVVRTSASDSSLSPEGSRLTPCYAGVTALPGRPALNCASSKNVLAKLLMTGGGSGPILFAAGANHYRLVGLEITRAERTGIVYALASIKTGGTANNLIFDRVWLHGTPHDETTKGVQLGGGSYISVIDSTVSDLHCVSLTGACTDASAISAGCNDPVGPFKVVDNFLEASGENILFGGAESATTPADIEIRENHLFKPLTWMKGQPGFVGGADGNPFIVKNLLELKNAQRVLIEANIMEYTWGGFSQKGYGILLTPKNQAGPNGTNLCPNCLVTDVTIRYNKISHVGGGMQIANALSGNGAPALRGERYSIHDLVVDDINSEKYAGSGNLAEIMTVDGAPLLQQVLLDHITGFPSAGLFSIGGNLSPKMTHFTFTNSLATGGTYPIWSTGGGTTNCAYYDVPLTTFTSCFAPYAFANNALIGVSSDYPPSAWPAGNHFPASASAVKFVSYKGGNGGDYHLLPASPYKNAGSDGKDLGADIDAILTKTATVY